MNVIGRTNGGSIIVGMSTADQQALQKLADGLRPMQSGLVVAEVSDKQIESLRGLVNAVKKGGK